MIAQKSVQEVLDTAKIEDVVEEFVHLKRRGVNMLGVCPFHNEKTPSFTVSPAKNIFKCFGCGKGGGPVQFLMEHETLSFPEAIRYLAKKYNIELEETVTTQENIEERQMQDSLYLVNQYAHDFFQDQLFNTDLGKSVGLSYFKKRGFREETIKKFGLGFVSPKRDSLTLSAVNKGYNIELLRKLSLTNQYDTDFFRDRVMFSIRNISGKIIGFAGRTLQTDNKKIPKYVNSPETEIYHKSKVLYGAHFARKSMRQLDECILVEGYTDVIALHQAGIENTVASSGTSLTVGQINLIKRYTPNIKILYDGDAAGIKAALRGLDLVLEQDMNVKVVLLPDGEDPDSYLQSVGSTAFREYIDTEAKDFILFKTNLLLQDAANDPIKKVNVTQEIVNSIARIPDAIKRNVFTKQCAQITDIEESLLIESVNKQVILLARKQREHQRREERRLQRQNRISNHQNHAPGPKAPSGDANFPDAPPPMGEEGDFPPDEQYSGLSTPQQASSPTGNMVFQERDIIRILINYGSQEFDKENNITVAEYILGNIEDVMEDFDNKEYENIAKHYAEQLLANQSINFQYFINHSNDLFRQVALDLSASPYEYSPNWDKMHDIHLQTQKMPEFNFSSDSKNGLLRFKIKKIERMMAQNIKKGKAAEKEGDYEKLMTHLKIEQKLKAIQIDISKQLGTVVLR